MKRLVMTIIAGSILSISGCAGHRKPKATDADLSPLATYFAQQESNLDHLEKSGAPRAEWAAHVEARVKEIKDGAQLEDVAGIPESGKTRALELLKQGYQWTYFPFLGNVGALVVFEHDRPKFVIRW